MKELHLSYEDKTCKGKKLPAETKNHTEMLHPEQSGFLPFSIIYSIHFAHFYVISPYSRYCLNPSIHLGALHGQKLRKSIK